MNFLERMTKMSKKNSTQCNLDEMQQLTVLKTAKKTLGLTFWCLFAAIVIQVCLTLSLKQIAGEAVVFFILCIYQFIAYAKNGISDQNHTTTAKKNAITSFISFLIMLFVTTIIPIIHPSIFSTKYILIMLSLATLVFICTFALSETLRKAIAKKRDILDNPEEDEQIEK